MDPITHAATATAPAPSDGNDPAISRAALAIAAPGSGAGAPLDIDAMVAKYVDGDWHDLPSGGRVRIRAMGYEGFVYSMAVIEELKKKGGYAVGQDLTPVDNSILGLRVTRDRQITDFDGFRFHGVRLPNRDERDKLHMGNLDLLLSLMPVRNEIMAAVLKVNQAAQAQGAAEEKNSPTPSPTN